MYNDDRVSPSKFTNMQKKHAVVLRCHMKTATILFYVSPSIKTHIKNAKTIDLMEVENGQKQLVPSNGVKDADILKGLVRRAKQMATVEIRTCTTKMKMTTEMMKKKMGKIGKWTHQVEMSPRGHQTRQVEQGPRKKMGKIGKWNHQVEMSPRGHQTRQVEQGPQTSLERATHE